MKISELKDEAALDAAAELIEPFAEILADKEVAAALRAGATLKAVKPAIKNHKETVMHILAVCDCVDDKDFHCGVLTLPIRLIELLNDPALKDLFSSQAQLVESSASGSAMATTVVEEN